MKQQIFAFNDAASDSISIPQAAIFISRACNDLTLLPNTQNHVSKSKILTLDDWSLCLLFIKDITKKKIKAYNAEKNIYPEEKNILSIQKTYSYHLSPIKVPVFDDYGVLKTYKTITPEVNYDSIYNFLIVQDFYFDFVSEKLYSKVIAVIPRTRVFTSMGIDLGLTNHWGLIFPEEKKKIIKLQKSTKK
ncbi:hypothetical protein [Ferruginibacter sp.]|nr:hypothetical protein [Ferruginibacter sp.]